MKKPCPRWKVYLDGWAVTLRKSDITVQSGCQRTCTAAGSALQGFALNNELKLRRLILLCNNFPSLRFGSLSCKEEDTVTAPLDRPFWQPIHYIAWDWFDASFISISGEIRLSYSTTSSPSAVNFTFSKTPRV